MTTLSKQRKFLFGYVYILREQNSQKIAKFFYQCYSKNGLNKSMNYAFFLIIILQIAAKKCLEKLFQN